MAKTVRDEDYPVHQLLSKRERLEHNLQPRFFPHRIKQGYLNLTRPPAISIADCIIARVHLREDDTYSVREDELAPQTLYEEPRELCRVRVVDTKCLHSEVGEWCISVWRSWATIDSAAQYTQKHTTYFCFD